MITLARLPTRRGIANYFWSAARHFSASPCRQEIKDIQSLAPRLFPLYKGARQPGLYPLRGINTVSSQSRREAICYPFNGRLLLEMF